MSNLWYEGSPNPRLSKIAEVLHRHIASALREKIVKDPRVGTVSVISVHVSPRVSDARIAVSVYEKDKADITIKILNKASGAIRTELANRVSSMRSVPRLHFMLDTVTDPVNKVLSIMEKIQSSEREHKDTE